MNKNPHQQTDLQISIFLGGGHGHSGGGGGSVVKVIKVIDTNLCLIRSIPFVGFVQIQTTFLLLRRNITEILPYSNHYRQFCFSVMTGIDYSIIRYFSFRHNQECKIEVNISSHFFIN